ncbi:MAG: right-handed parallel beta-helix repeat-containing protein [Actinomycetota bacterium]
MKRALVTAAALLLLLPSPALAHKERPTESPARPGSVPDQDRVPTQILDVCKTGECPHEHIQAAVNAASDGALIQIWPGTYHEEPSLAMPEDLPPDNPDDSWSFEFHVANPNAQNLIAILGQKNITLRGMGAQPRDVVIDGAFEKEVVIRGDRADGLIIENLSVWHGNDHGVYILDTDGFIIDGVHSGYSTDYPFLTFANDHGLMQNCEAFGGGDGGLYPGGSAETPGRFSMEIRNCRAYHNVLGYSGTQGNHVWVHDNEFFDNAVGLVSDSETDHPNYPQNNLVFERNKVYNNNFNPYLTTSDVEATVFAEFAFIPVGTGVFLLSGNFNTVQNNQFWNNDRYGLWLGSGYGLILGPTGPETTREPRTTPWMSSELTIAGNFFNSPEGDDPNGIDIAWDGLGTGTCFEENYRAPGVPATTDAAFLPPCMVPGINQPPPTTVSVPTASNIAAQVGLVIIAGNDSDGDGVDEPLCASYPDPCEFGPGPAPEDARNLPEGYRPPPDPTPCGPSTCGGSGDPDPEPTPTPSPTPSPTPDKPGKGPKPKKPGI